MSQQPLSVLISGAGVAGTSLALMLTRHPSFKTQPNITIVERSPIPRTTGQAVDIRGPAVEVIRRLGLEPEIKSRHTTEKGTAFIKENGQAAAVLEASGDAKSQSATSEYEILRGDLAGLLMEGIKDAQESGSHVKMVFGERIASFEELENGSGVAVSFANGKLESQRFDVVVGADGIRSATRAMMFGADDRKEHVRRSGMFMAFFTIPRVADDTDYWRWCTVPQGRAMHLRPHRNGRTMGAYLSITTPTTGPNPELDELIQSDVDSQKAYLRRRFNNAGWQSQRLVEGMDTATDFYMTHWCQVVTPQWSKSHCVTLGDAAHATMGVGTSLALTGAYCLTHELASVESTQDVEGALHRYEESFRKYTKQYERRMPGAFQLMNPQTAWGIWILHLVLRVVTALRIPQMLMRRFDRDDESGWKLPRWD